MKEQIENLKEAVDDGLSAARMAEDLTDKNLTLEDKIRNLQVQIEDLEVFISFFFLFFFFPSFFFSFLSFSFSFLILFFFFFFFQALRELNEELEQGHLETEKQLQDEIDYQSTLLINQVFFLSFFFFSLFFISSFILLIFLSRLVRLTQLKN